MEQFLISLQIQQGPAQDDPICIQQCLVAPSCKYILQNPEQLSRPEWLSKMIQSVRDPFCVEYWDYSKANLSLLQNEVPCEMWSKMKYKPIQFPESLVEKTWNIWMSKAKLQDLSFFGTLTPKRQAMIERLKEAGLSVLVIRHFGFSKIIEESCCARAILNLHAGPTQAIFESVRCGLFLDAGIPVLSEDSLDNDPRTFVFTEENLVSVCQQFIQKQNNGSIN